VEHNNVDHNDVDRDDLNYDLPACPMRIARIEPGEPNYRTAYNTADKMI